MTSSLSFFFGGPRPAAGGSFGLEDICRGFGEESFCVTDKSNLRKSFYKSFSTYVYVCISILPHTVLKKTAKDALLRCDLVSNYSTNESGAMLTARCRIYLEAEGIYTHKEQNGYI